jgi:CBS domain-containing protein
LRPSILPDGRSLNQLEWRRVRRVRQGEGLMTIAMIVRRKIADVVTAQESDDFLAVADKLTEHAAEALVVLNGDGGLAGIISEQDLVRGFARRRGKVDGVLARDLMTVKVFVCGTADSEIQVMNYMLEKGVRHMPVVEGGKVLGIVSLTEAVRHRLSKINQLFHEMERETDHEKRNGLFTQHLKSRRGPRST